MTRITLTKDMTAVRAAAKALIDDSFNRRYFVDHLPRSSGFAGRARAAKLVVAQQVAAGASNSALHHEAALRGISEGELAGLIIAKANEEAARLQAEEDRRQEQTLALLALNAPAEVDAYLATLDLPPHDTPPDF